MRAAVYHYEIKNDPRSDGPYEIDLCTECLAERKADETAHSARYFRLFTCEIGDGVCNDCDALNWDHVD